MNDKNTIPYPLPDLKPHATQGQEKNNGWPIFEKGWVWLTGAGPGDAGLLTLHGLNAINQADYIIYDALVNESLLAWAPKGAKLDYAGKRGGRPSPQQKDISERLISLAKEGARVLRLKGGDPFVFGRGGEEAHSLVRAGVPIRIIPGITAGIGGLAYAGIPLTHRDVNQAVTFLSGHDRHGLTPSAINWQQLATATPVIVMYMALKHIEDIVAKLIQGGRPKDEPTAIIINATLPDMQIVETKLGLAPDIVKNHKLTPPALICVGKNVLMRDTLDWLGFMTGKIPKDPTGDLSPSHLLPKKIID